MNILHWGVAYFVGEYLHWQEDHGDLERHWLVNCLVKKNPLPCSIMYHSLLPYLYHEMPMLLTREDEIQHVESKLKKKGEAHSKKPKEWDECARITY